jgi:hypothetical protein
MNVYTYVCIYIYIYICMYVCIYKYTHAHTHTHTHTHTNWNGDFPAMGVRSVRSCDGNISEMQQAKSCCNTMLLLRISCNASNAYLSPMQCEHVYTVVKR